VRGRPRHRRRNAWPIPCHPAALRRGRRRLPLDSRDHHPQQAHHRHRRHQQPHAHADGTGDAHLTKTGETLFQFDDNRDIPGGKTNRVVGTIDFAYGRLIYEAFGYFHLPLDSQLQLIPIIVRQKTNLLCQEQQ
jgi:hypothetical protein